MTPSITDQSDKPYVGYLRLTVDRNGQKIGYEVQRERIEAWAAYAGVTIGAWFQDRDITAADWKVERPQYERMLAEVGAGLWGGIVVWRLDRLVRLSYEFERCNRIMEMCGGAIVSIDPGVDTRTTIGKTMMRIIVMIAEMEVDAMRARARGHRQAIAAAGKYNGGGPRSFGFVGVVKDEEGNVLNKGEANIVHNQHEVELIREAAHRIAFQGWGWSDVLEEWATRLGENGQPAPVLGPSGKPMRVQTLKNILTSDRIMGIRKYTTDNPETGEPMTATTAAEWQPILNRNTVDALRSLSVTREPTGAKREYPLSNLLKCGRCGFPMTGVVRKWKVDGALEPHRTYHCKNDPGLKAQGACGSMRLVAEDLERYVLTATAVHLENTPAVVEAIQRENTTQADRDALQAALAEMTAVDEKLTKLTARWAADDRMSDNEYDAAHAVLADRRETARRVVSQINARIETPVPMGDDFDDLTGWLESLSLRQLRTLLTRVWGRMAVDNRLREGKHFHPDRVILEPRRDAREVDAVGK